MKTMTSATPKERVEIQKALNSAYGFIKNGWDLETAVLCAHDSVYDIIDVDDFISQLQAMISMMHDLGK